MSKIIADQLTQLGYSTEQTSVLNLPRLIINPFKVLHMVVNHLPLTFKEMLFLSTAKSLGKATVLTLLDANKNESHYLQKQFMNWVQPDALTVSQTNHLKIFRESPSVKMIMPLLFEIPTAARSKSNLQIEGFIFPLFQTVNESIEFLSDQPVYFDGRKLLKKYSSSQLRKKWTALLSEQKIPAHYHLVLSDDKIIELLSSSTLGLVLASSEMLHSDFTGWLKLSLQHQHLIILNQFQATGFSIHWTSGHNCLVISAHQWLKDLNKQIANPVFQQGVSVSNINKTSMDTIFNDLSRLYTKIIYQKTTLLDSDSAKI